MHKILQLLVTLVLTWISTLDLSSADQTNVCSAAQDAMKYAFGPQVVLYHYYPRCLEGGYFQNVQCDFLSCYCAYVDNGRQIPGLPINGLIRYMVEDCPMTAEKVPPPCSMPPPYYPCKNTMERYYYNSKTRNCERSDSSCLGFPTMEACSRSCVVTKRDRCNFRIANGIECERRPKSMRWYHDEKTDSCVEFEFQGCGGNSNNYKERWMCLKTCQNNETQDIAVQVADAYYFITLPTWVVELRQYKSGEIIQLSVEEFKEIEGFMTEISKYTIEGSENNTAGMPAYEKFRPEHANESLSRDEICSMDKEPGPCRAWMPRWYFDKTESKCIKFIYGGCYGNENRHESASGCATFCGAKVKPSEADIFSDILAGIISIEDISSTESSDTSPAPTDSSSQEDGKDDASERNLVLGAPIPIPSDEENDLISGEFSEIDFFV